MYRINPKIIYRVVDESVIIITPWNNGLHTTTEIGGIIIKGLVEEQDEETILTKILDQFDISKETALLDMNMFIATLINQKIFCKEGR